MRLRRCSCSTPFSSRANMVSQPSSDGLSGSGGLPWGSAEPSLDFGNVIAEDSHDVGNGLLHCRVVPGVFWPICRPTSRQWYSAGPPCVVLLNKPVEGANQILLLRDASPHSSGVGERRAVSPRQPFA